MHFHAPKYQWQALWFRLLCYKKEACFLSILYFPTPPPQGFESEISLCQEEKKVSTFTRTINTMTHKLCEDLRWCPCLENLQGIMQNHMGGLRKSVCSWGLRHLLDTHSQGWDKTVMSSSSSLQAWVREQRQRHFSRIINDWLKVSRNWSLAASFFMYCLLLPLPKYACSPLSSYALENRFY